MSNSPYCLPYNSHDVNLEKFGIGSTDNPLIDILLYSHHFYAWYCIHIVRRISLFVTQSANGYNAGL